MKKVLINLDVLLDTRLGSVGRYSQEAAAKVIANERYYYRDHDNWELFTDGLMDNELFKHYYETRGGANTAATLNASVLTNIIPVLHRMLGEELATHMDNSGTDFREVMLVIDLHPYELDLESKDELMGIIAELMGPDQAVDFINKGIAETTPQYIFDNYALVITYDMHEWLRLHYPELVRMRAASVNFIGPKLFEKDTTGLEDSYKSRELLKFKMDHLVCMNFDFINAEYFSVIKFK